MTFEAHSAVFQQADLDTCLTAAILMLGDQAEVIYRSVGATPAELADASVVCIEAGGSGQINLHNFDHHNTNLCLPPACVQAFCFQDRPPAYERMVEFTEALETRSPLSSPSFPNLSHLISGVRFAHTDDPMQQFRVGVREVRKIAELRIDPLSSLPWREEWAFYFEEKRRHAKQLVKVNEATELRRSGSLMIGFVETELIGAPGVLYRLGAEIAVVHCTAFGHPPRSKFTIGARSIRVDCLLPHLNQLDPGWGGPNHGTIIGSPRSGSRLAFADVCRVVELWPWRLSHDCLAREASYELT